MAPEFSLEPVFTADEEYNELVKLSFSKLLAQTRFCLFFVALAVLHCPAVSGDDLIRLDDDALKVVVTAEEQALGR